MDNTQFVVKLYEYLSAETPLNYDCGIHCNKKCCQGNDNDGMLLFPGEKDLFLNKDGYTVYFDERYDSYAVRCNGTCHRNDRPLSCRIFPYFFYVNNEDFKINVAPDIRAVDYCPIISKEKINKKFLRALRISALKIEQNTDYVEFLNKIGNILTDFDFLA